MAFNKKLVTLLGLIVSAAVVFTILIILMSSWPLASKTAGKGANRFERRKRDMSGDPLSIIKQYFPYTSNIGIFLLQVLQHKHRQDSQAWSP